MIAAHRTVLVALALVGLCCLTPSAAADDDAPRVTLDTGDDGARVGSALLGLEGRLRGAPDDLRHLTVRSSTTVGVLAVDDRQRFDLPVYLWADAAGEAVEISLRLPDGKGTGDELAVTDVALPRFDLTTLEPRLAALDTALLAADTDDRALDEAADDGLDLADALVDAGHPMLASVVLARVEAAAPGLPERLEPPRRADLVTARLQVDIVLGHTDAVDTHLRALHAAGLDEAEGSHRRALVAATDRLYRCAGLALGQGMPTATATRILDTANDLHARIGRLPRRLPRGY